MKRRSFATSVLCLLALFLVFQSATQLAGEKERHFLYVAVPGIRNYLEYGGIGILVYDIDNGYKFVKRIPTWDVPKGTAPENVKGIAASAKTAKVYVSTIKRLGCFDLITEKKVWERAFDGGCDRMAMVNATIATWQLGIHDSQPSISSSFAKRWCRNKRSA